MRRRRRQPMPQRREVVPEVPAVRMASKSSHINKVKAPRDAARVPRVVPEPRLDAEVPRDVFRARVRAVRGYGYRKLVVGVGRELVALQGRAVRF